MLELPRLLADFRPLSGTIKSAPEDFIVEEIPLYPADGHGTHTFFLVEKTGLTTAQAVHYLARALNVRRHEIGFAGQKDSQAVTRQWMSVEHVDPDVVAALSAPRLRILEVTQHGNKLRLGHLRANRFTIRIRQTEPQRLDELRDALAMLERRGAPNYFGPQRFGYRGDTWAIGRAILNREIDQAVDLVLGCPTQHDYPEAKHARELYERGDYLAAAKAWPSAFHTERRASKALAQSGGKRKRGFSAIDRTTRTFYVSAYQSHLFNRVVAARIGSGLEQLWIGDLAWMHASGAVFRVEDAALEQPRARQFEISPSGPLFGYRMTEPEGKPGEIEAAILADEHLSRDAFQAGPLRVKGARRPLRFRPADASVCLGADQAGPYLEMAFSLPRGCYATTLLRELFAGPSFDAVGSGSEGMEAPTA
jgi:tRNA pseudouridine13 synthase